MFNMHIDGLDRIDASFLDLASLSDEQIWAMILPAAEVLQARMRDVLTRLGLVRTGALRDSIEITRKISRDGAVYGLIGPNQQRHPGSSTGRRLSRHSPKSGGGSYAGTNAEVGFILEHGSARIPARHWMETACREAEDELYDILEAGWDQALAAAGF